MPPEAALALAALATAAAMATTLHTAARLRPLALATVTTAWIAMVAASALTRNQTTFLVLWPVLTATCAALLPGWPLRLLVGAALAVAWFSGGQGGVGESDSWLARLLNLSPDAAHALVVAIRKGVHFVFYGVVGALTAIAALRTQKARSPAVLLGLLMVAALGSFDEGRQSIIPTRSGSPWDILLNLSGGLTLAVVATRTGKQKGATRAAKPT